MMSALCSRAAARIFSQDTITPRSFTSKPLQERTTPTMFLPMSWTSPFTVAITILPAERWSGLAALSSSMKGVSQATAFFMTRADFTTCGRNILPSPKRSPTIDMPSMSGPSITFKGRPYCSRASSVSESMNSVMPLKRAYSRRFSTGVSLQRRSASCFLPSFPIKSSAMARSRSVASGRRLRITSSTPSSSFGEISSYTSSIPALTIPMSIPARVA